MLSTRTPQVLPSAADLQRLAQALAVLDAINSPDWEYRYYSYNPAWAPGEAVLEMRDGEGDEMLVLFRPEGCAINGFLAEYPQPDKQQVTRGLPEVFDEFLFDEPVASTGTTFCLWHTPAHGWQTGVLGPEDDGSEELLYLFDQDPATYAEWATEYYTDETDRPPITPEAVAPIYRHEVLTKAMVHALNPELTDFVALGAELQEIGYTYDFK
ncbi:hypothetical protein HHL22_00010 [Hymenobacter sp. RP-2-7]|uniref:Uncharacterized protein n=1 Tax=Hymenobacter polaris TaxID=2682546 RepID=A0A7Y0FKC9_9BACT|nr:hypothetical protein [Hymenobacter polaris]NML63583.1 hypothetical protein [Hymenobacter polaris]